MALVNRGLIVAGSERSVLAALARKENGGAGGLTSGAGLGRNLGRIDSRASAWALVDMSKFPAMHRDDAGGSDASGEPSRAIVGAMKSVSLIALQATVRGDAIELAATGVTGDSENRDLLEDSLRGCSRCGAWPCRKSRRSWCRSSAASGSTTTATPSRSGTLPASFLSSLGGHPAAR